MITAFSTALSGLNANSDAINVVGNDLANLNTTGYKANEVAFSDLISESLGVTGASGQLGLGVGQVQAIREYSQGSLQTTNGATDVALQGNGFFVVHDSGSGQTLYTRDGAFQIDQSGDLVTATGQNVQGWSAVNGVINPNGPIGNLSVPVNQTIPASATTAMNFSMNLDSRLPTAGASAAVTAPIQVYDSLGVAHTLTATFTHTGANAWSYAVTVPAADLSAPPAAPLLSGNLVFNSNGSLSTPTLASDPQTFSIAGLADGAANMNIGWNLYDTSGNPTISQYAEASSVNATTQDGYGAGSVTNVQLQNGGVLMANYSNGKQFAVGQIAIASIANPTSLSGVGDNNLAATANTATPVIGAADTGSRGHIVAGALESSTVDIASEFTKLLTFQRGYQADSRVITTSDQLLQETVNLIHG